MVVAVLLAALIAPLFIDWTSYRAEFEAQATAILGRPVKVAGKASARLIPFPSVTFDTIRVGDDVENPVLTAERFSMDAELAPFLSGELLIFDMRLTKPHGIVSIGKDGVADWTLRPNSPFDPKQVKIENLVVEDGIFDVIDEAGGATHRLAIASATISARALSGPWKLRAEATADGEPLVVQGSTGEQAKDGALPLRLQLYPVNRSIVIEADGNAASHEGKLAFNGQFNIRPASLTDPSKPALRGSDGAAPQAADTMRLSGKFDLSHSALALPELQLETGASDDPYIANGSGAVTFGAAPRFDIEINGNQVSLDEKGDKSAPAGGFSERLAAFRDFVSKVPQPVMPGSIKVALPAIVAGDTTIRDIGFVAEPANGAWRLGKFAATLPGRTRLEADGVLGTGPEFGFEGKLLAVSTQPAGLSQWLTGDASPALANLKAAGFSADVTLDMNTQRFDALEVAAGDASLKGSALRRTDGERPSLDVKLAGGRLQLDPVVAALKAFLDRPGATMPNDDYSISLDAGPVLFSGLEAQAVGFSARVKPDAADIDRLMVTGLAGASLSATARATELQGAPGLTVDGTVIADDGAQLVDALANAFPGIPALENLSARISATPGLLTDLNLSAVAATAADDAGRNWSLSGNAKASSGDASFSSSLKGSSLAEGTVTAQAAIRQLESLNFLSLAGFPVAPLGSPGPGTLELNLDGDLQSGAAVHANFSSDETSAAIDGAISMRADIFGLDGKATLTSADLDPYLLSTGYALPGTGLGTPARLAADIAVNDGGISAKSLEGEIAGNGLRGELQVATGERPKLTGDLALADLDSAWLCELALGTGTLGPIAEKGLAQEFGATQIIPFDAELNLSAAAFDLGPFGAASDFKGKLSVGDGVVRLDQAQAKFAQGALTANAELRNAAGTGNFTSVFALQGARMEALTGNSAVTALAQLGGSLAASGKSVEAMASSLTGSGIINLSDGAVAGLAPGGLAALLQNAGQSEAAPDPAKLDAQVKSAVLTGAYPINGLQAAWTAAGGVLRAPALRVVAGAATLDADAQANVADGEWRLSGRLRYDAGTETLAGADTVLPFEAASVGGVASFKPDTQPLVQYLTQRALEREQARVEAMQASLIEKQRLRRDAAAVKAAYAAQAARAAALESAMRQSAARQAAKLRDAWQTEKARREEEAKAKAAADAAKQAADASARALQEAAPQTPPAPALNLELNLTP